MYNNIDDFDKKKKIGKWVLTIDCILVVELVSVVDIMLNLNLTIYYFYTKKDFE